MQLSKIYSWLWMAFLALMLSACQPQVLDLQIVGIDDNDSYTELPVFLIDYSASAQTLPAQELDNQLALTTVFLNGVKINDYLNFDETGATVSDTATVTGLLVDGKNILNVTQVTQGFSGDMVYPLDSVTFAYSVRDPEIVVKNVQEHADGSTLSLLGFAYSAHGISSVTVNAINANLFNLDDSIDQFDTTLNKADSYLFTVQDNKGGEISKQFVSRGAFVTDAVRISVNDEIVNDQAALDAINTNTLAINTTMTIPGALVEYVSPLADVAGIEIDLRQFEEYQSSDEPAHIGEEGDDWYPSRLDLLDGVFIDSVEFLESSEDDVAQIRINMQVYEMNLYLQMQGWLTFGIPTPLDLNVNTTSISVDVALQTNDFSNLLLEMTTITLAMEGVSLSADDNGQDADGVFDSALDPIVSSLSGLIEGMVQERLNEEFAKLADLALGSVISVPDVIASDIRVVNFDSVENELLIDVQTAFHAKQLKQPAIGSVSEGTVIPFTNVYQDTTDTLALSSEEFNAVDYAIDSGTSVPTMVGDQNIGVVVSADLVNQMMLGLYESGITGVTVFADKNGNEIKLGSSDMPDTLTVSEGTIRVKAGLGAPLELAFNGDETQLLSRVLVPDFALGVDLYANGQWRSLLSSDVLARVGADVALTPEGVVALAVDGEDFNFTILQTKLLNAPLTGDIEAVTNLALSLLKPRLAQFIEDNAQIQLQLPSGIGLSNIQIGTIDADSPHMELGFSVDLADILALLDNL